jgi:hypothetical protein
MKIRLSIAVTLSVLLLFAAQNIWAQFSYTWPANGSKNNFTDPNIILLNGELIDPSSVSPEHIVLKGSASGIVPAEVVLSTDGKTICVRPVVAFKNSEQVTVEVRDGFKTVDGSTILGTSYNFSIRRAMTEAEKLSLKEYQSTHDSEGNLLNDPNQQSTYVPNTNGDLRNEKFKFVNIYTNSNPTAGRIFFHRNSAILPQGYGIMENNGDSVFFRATHTEGSNFQINRNGYLSEYKLVEANDTSLIVLDSSYNKIDSIHCKGGLRASQHEHILMPDKTKWFSIYDWQPGWDLTSLGGSDQAVVNVSWIQKLDANNNVAYEWRSDDHFQVGDAAQDILNGIGATYVDPWHINSMDLEDDGTLIVSLRNMDMIIKLNPATNNIIWYWGASTNYFPNVVTTNDIDGLFSHQHNVHRIENGNILMLDNGNLHTPPVTQPKQYTLDETTLKANLIWYYTHPQVNGFNMFTKQQGNAIRFSNGNTFIGYGLPNVLGLYNGAEIDANKNIVWEFRFKDSTEYSYRVYKYDWNPTGVAEIKNSFNQFEVFPNPTEGVINFEINVTASGSAIVSVSNFLGQIIYEQHKNFVKGKHKEQLDLSGFAKGFYTVSIIAGNKKLTQKILIQ